MTASSEIFSRKLAGFAAYLRKQGMHVGLGEVADMARALNQTGFENRETVRIAMKMLCAKTPREQEVFDQCFDQYFVSEEEFQKNAECLITNLGRKDFGKKVVLKPYEAFVLYRNL